MQDIKAWLSGDRDFERGAELYGKYGQNSFFKELLTAGPTPYNEKKLGEELEALLPSEPASVSDNESPVAKKDTLQEIEVVPQTHRSNFQRAEDHSRYIALCNRRDQIVQQLDRNMAALDFSTDRTVLHETAKQILRLNQQKQEIWAQIDHYQKNQSFEAKEPVKEKSREEKMQLIYQSISKARKRLADPAYQDKPRTQKLIEKKLKELESIKGGNE